jgi:hypothetical protein
LCADCNGVFGGTAFTDNCGTCVGGNTGLNPCAADCNGVFGGTAFTDNCGTCVGGNTGLVACVADCNGVFGGTAFLDECNICVGGNTGIEPCPGDCDVVLSVSSTTASSGIANGSATVQITGGQPPYTILWNDPLLQSALTATNLFAGNYTVSVTDANDCFASISVQVLEASPVPFTQLRGVWCNGIYELYDVVNCDLVAGAQDYRWQLTPVGGSPLPEYTRGSNNRNLRLSWVTGVALNQSYEVRVRAKVGGIWGNYGLMCVIHTEALPPSTYLLPSYSPNDPLSGLPYSFCNNIRAEAVAVADRYEWELTGPNTLLAESPSYFIQLGSIPGIQVNSEYQVRVRARVSGIWGTFGISLPIQLALPANTSIWVSHCNTVRATTSNVAAYNVCAAQSYTFRFQHVSEPERIVVRPTYVCPFNTVVPALTPGQSYTVSVKVTQGGVEGDYSTSCPITIAGPQTEGVANDVAVTKVLETSILGIYPNPNAGSEVRVDLNGIADGYHDVAVTIFDIYGKLMTRDVFGHQGAELSRLVRFEQELATGMYLVHIAFDGETFATEKLIVK